MAITAASSASSANAYATLFKNLNALTAKSTSSNTNVDDPATLLKTATNSVFAMADLMKRVKSLSSAADSMRANDASGLANVTKQMNSMLDEFNTIAGEKSADKAKATPTLAEVQATLSTMQTSLRENIRKVGASSIAAVSSGAFTNKTANNADSWSSWLASIKVNQKYLNY